MKKICVFCGSKGGQTVSYSQAVVQLAVSIAIRNFTLVYGGGSIGLMRIIAETVMQYEGKVIGVIPESLLFREKDTLEITDRRIVKNMHERKTMMADLSDIFIAMPGGLGTLEEFFEIWTWAQLGIHKKPIGLLNIDNYYDYLIRFLDDAVVKGFILQKDRNIIVVETDPNVLLNKLMHKQRIGCSS